MNQLTVTGVPLALRSLDARIKESEEDPLFLDSVHRHVFGKGARISGTGSVSFAR